ncbi:cyclin-domain-containing protein [Xylariales sp. PMI_506]|nr:cyclin-domain-containing protein [Xylariales sp. PMI_506]
MSSAISTLARPTIFQHLPSLTNSTGGHRQQRYMPLLSSRKVYDICQAEGGPLHTSGLRTPPAEATMSTAYQNPVLSSTYESHVALARQPVAMVQNSRAGGVLCDVAVNPLSRTQSHQHTQSQQLQSQLQYQHQAQHAHQAASLIPAGSSNPNSAASRHSTRPSTPSSTATSHFEGTVSRRNSSMVMHSLQLPSCISLNGGNLDDFAALMTCFFWFEDMDTIHAAEDVKNRRSSGQIPPLSPYTRPSTAYKKWVNSILSTTQVTQNVILLALLFVYRLKSTNPKVNGSPGSEYRLLTVALMLGNKFLDDNTYTNKTWAEVSGIAVKEIHVMEVEFLSNMRYSLLTSKTQWADWLKKLACFHEYCEKAELAEKAAEMARRQRVPAVPLSIPSPTHRGFSSPLPSPTGILPSTMQAGAATLPAFASGPGIYSSNQSWHGSFQSTPALSPLASKPNLSYPTTTRKRSLDGPEMVEPPAKRSARQTPAAHPSAMQHAPSTNEAVRLPVPQLTIDTTQISSPTVVYPAAASYSQPPVSLPPLGAGVRAMSTVYPHTSTWAPQGSIVATCGPQTPSYTAPSNFGTPTKRHSPGSLAGYASSPLTEPFPSHTPISTSPSIYLQQRNSPYKPVRPVNTLNYPPPSIPLSEYHLGSAQMHYQPLGRRNVRTGIVPEFLPSHGTIRPTPLSIAQTPGQNYPA